MGRLHEVPITAWTEEKKFFWKKYIEWMRGWVVGTDPPSILCLFHVFAGACVANVKSLRTTVVMKSNPSKQ